MDKNKRILLAVICAIFGFTSIILGTISYYGTTIQGTVTGKSKAFSFDVYHQSEKFTEINLYDTINVHNGKDGVINPGDSGEFTLTIIGTGSEVNLDYSIVFTSSNTPSNMHFYLDENKTNEITISNYTINGTINVGSDMTKTHTIYWQWPYDSGTNNIDDINYAGKAFTINVSASGKQVNE